MIYSTIMIPYSIYLHIPFCRHRCGYCDFNTYAGLETLIVDYVHALCCELEFLAGSAGERLPVHTIFFGGGTPSLLPIPELERVFNTIQAAFDLLPGVEVTLEANPGTLSSEYMRELHRLGVNRLSLGMQSAQPGELLLLERQHSYSDVVQAVTWARKAGFDNLNLDLIFGLPHQELAAWQNTLDLAVGLSPDHCSLYALSLEHGTPLAHAAARGLVSEPDPDLAADMYEWAAQRLNKAGFIQYEISNWARPAGHGQILACRHNLQYWRNQPYLGFGAGAHGYAGGVRTINVLAPAAYIHRLLGSTGNAQPPAGEWDAVMDRQTVPIFPCTPATVTVKSLERSDEIGETMMMGLRLVQEGVSRSMFKERFGQDLREFFAQEIGELSRLGLLEWAGEGEERLRLTPGGRLLGNQVFMQFI